MTKCKRLLILDDEMIIAMTLAHDLEDEGFEIVGPFNTLEGAHASLEDGSPDGALLDVNLGRGKTSFCFARKLEQQGVPFLFVTGYSATRAVNVAFGSAPVLSKPIHPSKVANEMRRLLAR